MRRRGQRWGGWPPGDAKRRDHQGRMEPIHDRGGTGIQPAAGAATARSAAEPGTNPQPARNAHGKSREIARGFTREAFTALAAVMQDHDAAATARVNAANTILEWGHGKRGESAKRATLVQRIVKVDWGKE